MSSNIKNSSKFVRFLTDSVVWDHRSRERRVYLSSVDCGVWMWERKHEHDTQGYIFEYKSNYEQSTTMIMITYQILTRPILPTIVWFVSLSALVCVHVRGIEALPKVAKQRMEDSAHEKPVMKEAAAGLISFLSAHRSLVDKPRLMGWKELTRCLFAAQRRQAKAELPLFNCSLSLHAADFLS